MARRVFLSFLAEDSDHANGVRLLAKNPSYKDLEFFDESVKKPYDSEDAGYIKRKIREKIERAGVTVVLCSENTHTSDWVNWEVRESARQDKPVIAMAVKGVAKLTWPAAVKEVNETVWMWNPELLGKKIESA